MDIMEKQLSLKSEIYLKISLLVTQVDVKFFQRIISFVTNYN